MGMETHSAMSFEDMAAVEATKEKLATKEVVTETVAKEETVTDVAPETVNPE